MCLLSMRGAKVHHFFVSYIQFLPYFVVLMIIATLDYRFFISWTHLLDIWPGQRVILNITGTHSLLLLVYLSHHGKVMQIYLQRAYYFITATYASVGIFCKVHIIFEPHPKRKYLVYIAQRSRNHESRIIADRNTSLQWYLLTVFQ